MQPIHQIINQLLPKLATPEFREPEKEKPTSPCSLSDKSGNASPSSPPRLRPLRTPWQQKWLDLEACHDDVQRLADAASAFCGRWFRSAEGVRLLVVTGEPGCGKTHVARRVAGWAQASAFTAWAESRSPSPSIPAVRFVEWADAANPERMEERDFLRWLGDVDGDSMLVVDDSGAETDRFKGGVPIARLTDMLNRRAGKFTMLTTNKPPALWPEQWDERVTDRLMRRSEIVVMSAPSFAVAPSVKHPTEK